MKINYLFALFVLTLISCQSPDGPRVVRGEGIYIPFDKVYLSPAFDFETIIDSSLVIDGKFEFKIQDNLDPSMVLISYKSQKGKIQLLYVANPYDTKVKGNYKSFGYFMLEKGETLLKGVEGFSEIHPYVEINEGTENSLFLKSKGRNLVSVDTKDEDSYTKSIERIKTIVKKHSDSFYLLGNIYENRVSYTKDDLKDILSLFDKRLKESESMSDLTRYLSYREDNNDKRSELSLVNENGQYIEGIDRSKPLNMLVFWASWCGPCRLEVPQLKNIHAKFDSPLFNIVSISIDEDPDSWRKAMEYEKMGWEQFIVSSDSIPIIKAKYNFNAIPLVIFTDSSGKELRRFIGFHKDNPNLFAKFISDFMHQEMAIEVSMK